MKQFYITMILLTALTLSFISNAQEVIEVDRTIDKVAVAKFLAFQNLRSDLAVFAEGQSFSPENTFDVIQMLKNRLASATVDSKPVFQKRLLTEMTLNLEPVADQTLIGPQMMTVNMITVSPTLIASKQVALVLNFFNVSTQKIQKVYIVFKDRIDTPNVFETQRIQYICNNFDDDILTTEINDAGVRLAFVGKTSPGSRTGVTFRVDNCMH